MDESRKHSSALMLQGQGLLNTMRLGFQVADSSYTCPGPFSEIRLVELCLGGSIIGLSGLKMILIPGFPKPQAHGARNVDTIQL